MADYYCKSQSPFADSFFSANHAQGNVVPIGQRSCLSLVLHLDGQLETFCVHANTVLIRPSTARERDQLIQTYEELSVLLQRMECALDAHLCFT